MLIMQNKFRKYAENTEKMYKTNKVIKKFVLHKYAFIAEI